MELWSRLIHAAIGRLSLIFFWAIPSFFFFFLVFLRHILNLPITLHLLSHPPSLRSEPSPSPSIFDKKPSPHPPSPISTFASPFNSRLFVFALSRRLGYWCSSLSLPHQVQSLSAFYLILRLLDLVCFSLNLL